MAQPTEKILVVSRDGYNDFEFLGKNQNGDFRIKLSNPDKVEETEMAGVVEEIQPETPPVNPAGGAGGNAGPGGAGGDGSQPA